MIGMEWLRSETSYEQPSFECEETSHLSKDSVIQRECNEHGVFRTLIHGTKYLKWAGLAGIAAILFTHNDPQCG